MRTLIILIIGLYCSPLKAEILDVPVNPNGRICRQIAENNSAHLARINAAHSDCLKVPGEAPLGGGCTKAGCLRLHRSMVSTGNAVRQINSTCNDRARSSRRSEVELEFQRQRRGEEERHWAERVSDLDKSVRQVLTLNENLENPLRLLAIISNKKLNDLKRSIGSRIRTANGMYSDPNAALMDEMYLWAGRANRRTTNSPFRTFVTQASLDALYFHQSYIDRRMKEVNESIKNFDAFGPSLSTPFRPSTHFPIHSPIESDRGNIKSAPDAVAVDCSTLNDVERSRNLSIFSEDAWLQLVERCSR